jgi:hypothetical protein
MEKSTVARHANHEINSKGNSYFKSINIGGGKKTSKADQYS